MSPQFNDYGEIRQVVQDALAPLKEQLDRIYDSLSREFVRKDAIDPRMVALEKDVEEMRKEVDELKSQVLNAPQRLILYISSLVGLALSLVALSQYFQP